MKKLVCGHPGMSHSVPKKTKGHPVQNKRLFSRKQTLVRLQAKACFCYPETVLHEQRPERARKHSIPPYIRPSKITCRSKYGLIYRKLDLADKINRLIFGVQEKIKLKLMKKVKELTTEYKTQNLLAGIDMTGSFKELFRQAAISPRSIFLLCLRGTCKISIHLTQYEMEASSLAIILPGMYFQILNQTSDCRFMYVGIAQRTIENSHLFSQTIEYTPSILDQPVLKLTPEVSKIFQEAFMAIIRTTRLKQELLNDMQIGLLYTQLLITAYNANAANTPGKTNHYNRNQEIVKELVRYIIQYYKKERNVAFYADKMHLSPQHLSTTVKKVTNKTLTDLISSFIIRDAQAKLRSTEMTIQEIAYSLNFSDISFFGKYFKRYTGMSPKQYRNSGTV